VEEPSDWVSRTFPTPSNVTLSEKLVDFAPLLAATAPAAGSSPATAQGPAMRNVVSWLPADTVPSPPAGILIIQHGLHEHALRHHAVAVACASELKLAVYGMDLEGHGKSAGLRGMINDYSKTVDELVAFVDGYVRPLHLPGLPLFFFCHSCGSLFSLAVLPRLAAPAPVAAVLSATAIVAGPDSGSPFGFKCLFPLTSLKSFESLVAALAAVDPKGDGAPIIREGLMHDVEEQQIHKADFRIYNGCIRTKTAYELVKLQKVCLQNHLANFPPSLSVSIHHGADDQLIFPVSSEQVFAKCPCPNKELRIHAL